MEQQRPRRAQPAGRDLGQEDRAAAEDGHVLAVAEQRGRLVGGRRHHQGHIGQSHRVDSAKRGRSDVRPAVS